jgi:hypothetical protein
MRIKHPFVEATPCVDSSIRVFRRMILRVDGSNYRGVWPVTRKLTSHWCRENFGEHARESFEIRYFGLQPLTVNTYGSVVLRCVKVFVQRKREKYIELIWTQFTIHFSLQNFSSTNWQPVGGKRNIIKLNVIWKLKNDIMCEAEKKSAIRGNKVEIN